MFQFRHLLPVESDANAVLSTGDANVVVFYIPVAIVDVCGRSIEQIPLTSLCVLSTV